MLAVTVNSKVKNSLKLEEVPVPPIAPDEVLVRIHAAALNHRDLYVNNAWRFLQDGPDQLIAGGDGAGVIVEVGENTGEWSVGDEVMLNPYDMEKDIFLGGPHNGTFGEFIKVSANTLIRKPTYLSFQEAAAVPLALSTAWGTVVTKGAIKSNETILLQGIGGGVALFILQLLNKLGVYVIVTSGSNEKLEAAKKLGAMAGINYKTENVVNRVLELTKGKGVDVSIDSSGKDSIESSTLSLAENGRLLVFGSTTGGINWDELRKQKYFVETGMVNQQDLQEAVTYYTEQQLKPIISSKIYSLKEYKDAYKELEKAEQFGKIIIQIS
ncbi:NADPH:quinone reductase-like Zn-dependent oxidoreductase [Bacillus mesophilus]|uniref:Zinc-binding dehydrogenase n=1 Tax=Bacillus mesophilus TaxID=1808955 RepID=A0A6M0Q4I9_9BACI|nr:zinc-binding dehydrogenase [Bacillus mesophilus]MBM7661318.1 NADPH:quinone reductase-like Zn-dependent oxidoreductase [Bacillus mesophilus]NEY71162.1 zinc-binding dehydrogenase [Bacillus mesophilus]